MDGEWTQSLLFCQIKCVGAICTATKTDDAIIRLAAPCRLHLRDEVYQVAILMVDALRGENLFVMPTVITDAIFIKRDIRRSSIHDTAAANLLGRRHPKLQTFSQGPNKEDN